ncbi:hypothetical protein [Actinoplanes palleronii]|uniref:Serine/threonine protein kinase n=1 Tax=Actinoplanes palleronii TaxID=113570 RepID=A0ABQ4BE68_9ACTN|nr:hypothetical protein [Actinoplanes palleronii]GIE68636.1 hypothetical protein Apa02nite_047440 [Actinoplanes palleronii]
MSHDNPFPQDPTTTLPPAKTPRKGSGFATFLALVAVLLAAGAVALAWHAGSVASDAADRVDALAAKQVPAAGQPATTPADAPAQPTTTAPAEPTTESTPAADGSPPALTETTQFTQKYVEQNLGVPSDCNSSVYIDLDEPKVQADSAVSELSYYNPCDAGTTPYLSLQSGVTGTTFESETFQPGACVGQIPLKPLAKEGRLPVRQGQVYCLITSVAEARKAAVPQRLVALTVAGVAKDGALALKATAWDAPN